VRDFSDFPRIDTARLILRAMTHGDAEGYGELLSDESAYPYITDAGPIDASQIRSRISRNHDYFLNEQAIYWALEYGSTFIGYVALHGPIQGAPALSYAIRRDWRRRGFAAEAIDAVCNHAFSVLGSRELVARSHFDNAASEALLRRLGFRNLGPVSVPAGRRREFRRAAA
jgi:ribosomal-protein-alanine N-acetyltransferase